MIGILRTGAGKGGSKKPSTNKASDGKTSTGTNSKDKGKEESRKQGQTVNIEAYKNGASDKLNYVVKSDGTLVLGKSGHTSLTGGKAVQAAGEVHIVNGKIKYIDNSSGHYQPPKTTGNIAEDAFKNAGFDSQGKFVSKIWVPDKSLPRGGSWKIEK